MQSKWPVIISIAIIAATLGFGLGHYSADKFEQDLFTQTPTASITAPELMSTEAALLQRENHYQNITTIREVLSLPSLFAQKEALHTIAGRADRSQIQLLLTESQGVADVQLRNQIQQILAARLTEIDPEAAAKLALQAYQNRNYALLHEVYANWANLDLDAAIQSANNISNTYQQTSAAQGVLAAIDTSKVQLRHDVSNRLGIETTEQQFMSDALIEKAVSNPEAAMLEAMNMPKGYERESAMQGIMDSWAIQNPREAFSFADQIQDNRIRKQLQETVLYRWAESDPNEAYEVMQTLPNAGVNSGISYTVFNYLASENPNEALNLIEKIPSARERHDAYSATISTWAAADAKAAASFVAQLDNKQLMQQLAPTVVQYLSTESPEDALLWAKELDPNGVLYLQNTVVSQIANTNPDRAFQIAQNEQHDTVRHQLLVSVIDNLSYTDPSRAASMIDQLSNTDVTVDVINSVVYNWANNDPDAAMAWVNTKSGEVREAGLTSIGSQLASMNPDLAASYLPQLSGPVRQSWAQNITYYYSSYDLEEAALWVENFRGEKFYTELLHSLASTAASTDVDYALDLAQNMPTVEERNHLIRQIADQISYSNPERAQLLYSRLPKEDRPQS